MGFMDTVSEIIASRRHSQDLKALSVEDYLTKLSMVAAFAEEARSRGASGVLQLRSPNGGFGDGGIDAVDLDGPRLHARGGDGDYSPVAGWWLSERDIMGTGFDYSHHRISDGPEEIEAYREHVLRGFAETLEHTLRSL